METTPTNAMPHLPCWNRSIGSRQMPVHLPDQHSFYTPPTRRAPFNPDDIVLPTLQPDELLSLRSLMLRDVTQAFSPEKVNRKVLSFFNGHQRLNVTELPRDVLDDLHSLEQEAITDFGF